MFGDTLNSFIYNLNLKQKLRFIEFLSTLKDDGNQDAYETGGYRDRHISIDDLIEDINSTIEWDEIRKLKEYASVLEQTTIPKDSWGVHEHHCCSKHGCKYGDEDCPVAIGLTTQVYPCEYCDERF